MVLWGLPYQKGGLSYAVHAIPLKGLSTLAAQASILETGLVLAPVQLTGPVLIFLGPLL